MHDFFLVFMVRSSQLTCLWMSAYAKGNLTRFSHDSGVMIFHLKIGSSGKKSLVKCSRTASIMSNFTTWHCVKDEMDKEGSIVQMSKCSSSQVFKFKFMDKKAQLLKCSPPDIVVENKSSQTSVQVIKRSSDQVFKFKFMDKKAQVLKCLSTASVFLDHFVIFPWSNKVTINKQDLESIN